jgi:hypothetical protein
MWAHWLIVLASFAIAIGGTILVPLNGGTVDDAQGITAAAVFLLPLMLGSGLVSSDVRSGVAVLWLQKPGGAIDVYFRRWLEVTALTMVLLVVLLISTRLILSAFDPSIGSVMIVRKALSPLPLVLTLSAVLFVLSAWGVRHDGVFALVAIYASAFIPMSDVPLGKNLGWMLIPLNEIGAASDLIVGEYSGVPEHPVLIPTAYLLACIVLALVGIAVTTRSPIPKDVTR